ncbi:MAG: FAD-dependent oxidoreductase, partial [Candidatus Hodarchaeales archaeon]
HNLSHAEELRTFLKTSAQKIQSVAIIGAGYIGLEMLEAYKAHGIKDISIIGPRLIFKSQSHEYLHKELESHKIKTILGKKVRKLESLSRDRIKIQLDDHSSLETDLVQISIGVSPATEIFKDKGLKMLPNGAILTDEYMKTNIADVYAAGDCIASYHRVSKQHVYYPLAPAANKQGRLAGSRIAGKDVRPYPGIVGTSIFKVLDLHCARTGISLEHALELGYDAESILIENNEIAHYMGTKKMSVLLVFDVKTHLLLGAEITAPNPLGAKKIDTLVTALYAEMRIEDIQALDLAYAPPFAPVWDPILIAANIASKKLMKKER